MLREALWQQARLEVEAQQLSSEQVNEEPVTEYTESFIKEGFTAEPIRTDPEVSSRRGSPSNNTKFKK